MEEIIQKMLTGRISMRSFIDLTSTNPDLIYSINALIPEEAKNTPEHPVWLCFSYDAMKTVDFILWNEINSIAKFDDSLGDNLNIFSEIEYFYCYSHPDFKPTKKYHEEFDLFLDVAGETYGGPEVDYIINDVIRQCLKIQPKTKRIKAAKEKIAEIFHVEKGKRPYWIQGAEWPMGQYSPMKFLNTKKNKEKKIYIFEDVYTKEQKQITQYY